MALQQPGAAKGHTRACEGRVRPAHVPLRLNASRVLRRATLGHTKGVRSTPSTRTPLSLNASRVLRAGQRKEKKRNETKRRCPPSSRPLRISRGSHRRTASRSAQWHRTTMRHAAQEHCAGTWPNKPELYSEMTTGKLWFDALTILTAWRTCVNMSLHAHRHVTSARQCHEDHRAR